MSLIRVDLDYPIEDGSKVTFKAPCNSNQATGLKIYYPVITENGQSTSNQTFTFADSATYNITGIEHLFVTGAYVSVILDTTNNRAYLQNGDTNHYLEARMADLESDVEVLSNPAEMWAWKKFTYVAPSYELDTAMGQKRLWIHQANAQYDANHYVRFQIGDSISVDENGIISIDNPSTTDVYMTNPSTPVHHIQVREKFFKVVSYVDATSDFTNMGVCWCPSDVTWSATSGNIYVTGVQQVIVIPGHGGDIVGYVSNPTSTFYPADGKSGDYWYTRLGQIGGVFDGAKNEFVSYVGTGTYGSSSPNSLTFDFVPKVLIYVGMIANNIFQNSTWNSSGYAVTIPPLIPTTYSANWGFNVSNNYTKVSPDRRTITWYSSANASTQLNGSGYTYCFLAIG